MRRIHRIIVRHLLDARTRELTSGTLNRSRDDVLAHYLPDYQPEDLLEPAPGAWMPQCRTPPIIYALRRNHAGGSTPKGGL